MFCSVGLAASVAATACVVGCGGRVQLEEVGPGTTSTTGTETGTGTGLNTATSSDTWTATETSTGSSTDSNTGYECWELSDEHACLECCNADYANELGQLEKYFILYCACHLPANPVCYDACEAWCMDQGQLPDTNCAACMESVLASDAGCLSHVQQLCLEDPSCAAFVECQNGC